MKNLHFIITLPCILLILPILLALSSCDKPDEDMLSFLGSPFSSELRLCISDEEVGVLSIKNGESLSLGFLSPSSLSPLEIVKDSSGEVRAYYKGAPEENAVLPPIWSSIIFLFDKEKEVRSLEREGELTFLYCRAEGGELRYALSSEGVLESVEYKNIKLERIK